MQPGDSCFVEGSGFSGFDNCDATSMCWYVHKWSNEGVCIPFCKGSEQSPVCDDPSTECNICNDGVLILCLPDCDPLLQDCPQGHACYVFLEGPVCSEDASGDGGAAGDPCQEIDACDPGLGCINADFVPDCPGPVGCCAPFCDLYAPDCNAAAGEECVPWWEEDDAPVCPNLEHLGVCSVPP
jgi:hypothetical protein